MSRMITITDTITGATATVPIDDQLSDEPGQYVSPVVQTLLAWNPDAPDEVLATIGRFAHALRRSQHPETSGEESALAIRWEWAPSPGRPVIGPQIKIAFPADLLADVDAAAEAARTTRSEWVRYACRAALPRR